MNILAPSILSADFCELGKQIEEIEAVQMVMDGKIPDAKTQIALLKTKMIVDSGK